MTDQDTQSDQPSGFSQKQRFEMERWARLNDMSLEEFLKSDLLKQLEAFRAKRRNDQENCASQ